jgi:hypothetical protein
MLTILQLQLVGTYWQMFRKPPNNTTSVACAVGPSVNPLQKRETQHVNIVLQCMYQFFEQPNMNGNHAWIEW